eukprot:15332501-Ditylum_brightwellii.AAC.1
MDASQPPQGAPTPRLQPSHPWCFDHLRKTVKIQPRFSAKPTLQITQPKSQEENRTLVILEKSAKVMVAICTMASAPLSRIEPLYADYQDSL